MYFAYVENKERPFIGTWMHTKENSSAKERLERNQRLFFPSRSQICNSTWHLQAFSNLVIDNLHDNQNKK
jgi:hypothetical protein